MRCAPSPAGINKSSAAERMRGRLKVYLLAGEEGSSPGGGV